MTSNEKGEDNYIPKNFVNSDLFLSLIEAVHNEYFNGLNELSKEDRISFTEIVILKLMSEIRNQ